MVLRGPHSRGQSKFERRPRRTRLVVNLQMLFHPLTQHRYGWRERIHQQHCELLFTQPRHHVRAPAASLQDLRYFAQGAIRGPRAESIAQHLRIFHPRAQQHQRASPSSRLSLPACFHGFTWAAFCQQYPKRFFAQGRFSPSQSGLREKLLAKILKNALGRNDCGIEQPAIQAGQFFIAE